MGMREVRAVGMSVGFFLLLIPTTVHAADGQTVEAAEAHTGVETASREQILQTIEATRNTDPELAAEMERQLNLMESGQSGQLDSEKETPLPMPVVDVGGGTGGLTGEGRTGAEEYLPPEARQELEELFSQGTGDPNSETDRALREKAHEILEKYGIEPREMGAGHEGEHDEGRHEGFERAFEHMAPEAREQMEGMQRELESTERTFEAPVREYEAPMHEYQAPERMYEAPEHQYESQLPQQ